MPILFKTAWKNSQLHGKGVFATEDIPKDSVWWTADQEYQGICPQNCIIKPNDIYDKQSITKLAQSKSLEQMINILNQTMYFEGGEKLIHLNDGTGVLNHNANSNSVCNIFEAGQDYTKLKSVALVDIKAGQQIVQNYGYYTKSRDNWVEKIYSKYLPSRLQFQSEFKIAKLQIETSKA